MRIEISHTINIFMPIHNVHCNMNLWEIAKAGNYFKWPLDKIQVVLALRVLTKYDQLSDQLRAFHPIPYHHYFHTQVILSQDLTCPWKPVHPQEYLRNIHQDYFTEPTTGGAL